MTKSKFWRRLKDSAEDLKAAFGREILPQTCVVLGSGFKNVSNKIEDPKEIFFSDIANFPVPTVSGHGASLVCGRMDGIEVIVMTGRIHMYEGWDAQDVVYPIRVLSTLGVQNLLLTNAAGSVTPEIRPGAAMVLTDHINLTGRNCLVGDAREFGESLFIDMGKAYEPAWRQRILERDDIIQGVYAGVLGPNYETTAEVEMMHRMGAQVVGMSTVQETIAAVHLKMKVAAISFVTNMAGGVQEGLNHQEVLDLAADNEERLCQILLHAIKSA